MSLKFIKLGESRIRIDSIISYSYDGEELWVETDDDYFKTIKSKVKDLDHVVDLLDENLCLK